MLSSNNVSRTNFCYCVHVHQCHGLCDLLSTIQVKHSQSSQWWTGYNWPAKNVPAITSSLVWHLHWIGLVDQGTDRDQNSHCMSNAMRGGGHCPEPSRNVINKQLNMHLGNYRRMHWNNWCKMYTNDLYNNDMMRMLIIIIIIIIIIITTGITVHMILLYSIYLYHEACCVAYITWMLCPAIGVL